MTASATRDLDVPLATAPTLAVAATGGGAHRRRARWAGLDGLRAVAVVAVVAFHFAPGAVPGGFLGVDLFFVLSGYLITRMLATEYVRTGGVDFTRFYLHRARRLLPGLALVVVASLAAATVWRDQLGTVRQSVAAAAGYVSNWWLAFGHHSYFASSGRPGMLQHLWSLAVEEQFYLVWPAVAVLVLRSGAGALAPGRAVRRLAVVATILALASTATMAVLAVRGHVPFGADGSRLYYGTDTHSMGLLLGSAAGALAADRLRPRPRGPRLTRLTDLIGLGALLALAALFFLAGQYDGWLYRGGFLLVAALGCASAATLARRGSTVGPLLDRQWVRWLAARSYAIYLWHWPITVITRPGVDVHWPAPLVLVVRVGTTLALADWTYRGVEAPIRAVGLRRAARNGLHRANEIAAGRGAFGARSAAAIAALTVAVAGSVLVNPPTPPVSAAQRAFGSVSGVRAMPLGPRGQAGPGTAPPTPVDHSVSAYGDSVMLGAREALARGFPGGTLDAVEGRQPGPILADVRADAERRSLHPTVIIGVGDNGLIRAADLDKTLRVLAGHRVVVITNRVGRPWEGPNNRVITRVAAHFSYVRVLDWHARSAGHRAWFYEDGIHLTPPGVRAYVAMLVELAR